MKDDTNNNFETTRFHHFQFGGGHVTVAFKIDTDKNARNRKVRYACSFTSPRDTFNRAKGRMIAEGRLNFFQNGRVPRERLLAKEIFISVPEEKPLKTILDTVKLHAEALAISRCPWAKPSV